MGGSGGFAKGGAIGAGVDDEAKEGANAIKEPEARTNFRRGGSVGGDTKARYKGTIHKGR
jgi:hypothetical protein